ncbi:hypothetical protein M405DRAFT_488314 [Rhizopogon salebrosus TDB-379]|nr:hypothetical protein M405DRAFT_488314 [Rhizopogon salebrosus TDB-379]
MVCPHACRDCVPMTNARWDHGLFIVHGSSTLKVGYATLWLQFIYGQSPRPCRTVRGTYGTCLPSGLSDVTRLKLLLSISTKSVLSAHSKVQAKLHFVSEVSSFKASSRTFVPYM